MAFHLLSVKLFQWALQLLTSGTSRKTYWFFIPAVEQFQLDRDREHCGWRGGLQIGQVSQDKVAKRKMPNELIVS